MDKRTKRSLVSLALLYGIAAAAALLTAWRCEPARPPTAPASDGRAR
jgi:hypothetical protein